MRIGLALLGFLISYNLYLYKLATVVCDMRIMKLWNYYSIGALLLVVFFVKSKSYFDKVFKKVCKISIMLTITTIILTNHAIILNPYYLLGIINLGTCIATLSILISGSQHGYFKNKYENE